MQHGVARATIVIAIAFLAASFIGATVGGAARVDASPGGRLDPTFASGGTNLIAFSSSSAGSSQGAAVAVQPDGQLVVAATLLRLPSSPATFVTPTSLVVARFAEKGVYDTGFGSKGMTQLSDSSAADVALQRDGKIVVAGRLRGSPGLVRLTAAGGFDPSFGTRGIAKLAFPATSVYAIAIDVEGRIVGVGYDYAAGDATPSFVFRCLPTGGLDPSFGDGGVVRTSLPITTGSGGEVAIQPDGKIVVAGARLARLTDAGALDATFGSGGVVPTAIVPGTGGVVGGLAFTPSGRILVGADSNVVRLTASGRLDRSFGGGGTIDSGVSVEDLVVEGRGGFEVAGAGGRGSLRVARFLPGGVTDSRFGDDGSTATSFGFNDPTLIAVDLARAPDGKLVALATPNGGIYGTWPNWYYGDTRFGLARYLPRSCTVPSLVKQRLPGAKASLREAGCPLGNVRYVRSRKVSRSVVTGQQPPAQSLLPADGAVDLVVRARRLRGKR